jgi:hypothetical protein
VRQFGVAVVAFVTSLPLWAQQPMAPFVVAVWSDADNLLPFADFDGRQWRTIWPAPESEPDIRPLQRIPQPWWGRSTFQPTWDLLEPGGTRRNVQITGTAAAGLGSGCSRNIGLTTDISRTEWLAGAAVASSRPGVLEHIEVFAPESSGRRAVAALLPSMYQRYEASAWSGVPSYPDDGPLRLERAFAFRSDTGEYVYFESFRDSKPQPEQLGEERSVLTGWLWRRSQAMPFQRVVVDAGRRDLDGKGTNAFRPVAVVRHASRQYWIGALSSYAYSGMVVIDVRRAGVTEALRVDYGGC